jgi:hypothetical protein
MNFSIYLDEDLHNELPHSAQDMKMTRNGIKKSGWPAGIFDFKIKDFPDINELRAGLKFPLNIDIF